MSDPKARAAEDSQITLLIAQALGLDPSTISQDGFTADWSGDHKDPVRITWTGIKTLPLAEWEAVLNQIIKEKEETE